MQFKIELLHMLSFLKYSRYVLIILSKIGINSCRNGKITGLLGLIIPKCLYCLNKLEDSFKKMMSTTPDNLFSLSLEYLMILSLSSSQLNVFLIFMSVLIELEETILTAIRFSKLWVFLQQNLLDWFNV
jgi:hypothetical protein